MKKFVLQSIDNISGGLISLLGVSGKNGLDVCLPEHKHQNWFIRIGSVLLSRTKRDAVLF